MIREQAASGGPSSTISMQQAGASQARLESVPGKRDRVVSDVAMGAADIVSLGMDAEGRASD